MLDEACIVIYLLFILLGNTKKKNVPVTLFDHFIHNV